MSVKHRGGSLTRAELSIGAEAKRVLFQPGFHLDSLAGKATTFWEFDRQRPKFTVSSVHGNYMLIHDANRRRDPSLSKASSDNGVGVDGSGFAQKPLDKGRPHSLAPLDPALQMRNLV